MSTTDTIDLDDLVTTADQDGAVAAARTPVRPGKKPSFAHRLWTGDISYDFIGHRRWWYLLSAALLIISIAAILIRGLNFGIEFRGGSQFQVDTQVTATTVDDFRQAVLNSGVGGLDAVTVATIGNNRVQIQTKSLESAADQVAIRQAIAAQAGTTSENVAYQQIGASWGRQITTQAAWALGIFLIAVVLMIGIYFRDLKMALASIIKLIHDMIITVGIYALVGFAVTPATLTGLLTILGYSLYDNVVVFDKIRENVATLHEAKTTYREAANHSVNQVIVRSINTTVVGVLPVAAILFAGVFILGSGPLEDIGLALFVGMIIGAYSSIFIATPLLVEMKEREPAIKEQAARVERRREKLARSAELASQTVTVSTVPADAVAEAIVGDRTPKPAQFVKQSRAERKQAKK